MSSKKRLVLIAALLISITGFMVWRYSDGHRPARPSMPRLKGSGKALGFSRLIAHAGGQIQSRVYTNSRQALTRSYQNGFRFIEIDLDWTSDQELVLIHDWDKTLQKYCNRKPGACSLAEFRGLTLEYGLTQLTLDDLAQWMRKFPDVYIVTDIKRDNLRALEKIRAAYPELTARYIPQIYRFEEYSPVRSLGYENIILTLYRSSYRDEDIIRFARGHVLGAVTMPILRAAGGLPRRLGAIGVPVFAHTVNDPRVGEALSANGVFGVYTDFLLPGGDDRR